MTVSRARDGMQPEEPSPVLHALTKCHANVAPRTSLAMIGQVCSGTGNPALVTGWCIAAACKEVALTLHQLQIVFIISVAQTKMSQILDILKKEKPKNKEKKIMPSAFNKQTQSRLIRSSLLFFSGRLLHHPPPICSSNMLSFHIDRLCSSSMISAGL